MEELKSQGVDTQALWQVFIFFAPLPSPLLSPCSCDQTSRWSEGRCAGECMPAAVCVLYAHACLRVCALGLWQARQRVLVLVCACECLQVPLV